MALPQALCPTTGAKVAPLENWVRQFSFTIACGTRETYRKRLLVASILSHAIVLSWFPN